MLRGNLRKLLLHWIEWSAMHTRITSQHSDNVESLGKTTC